uniref:NADH dehydrogenase subunit 2, mitochondrial n=1 Tax=Tanacetum cinerariifolium TaxID=118510 RepID=A0A699H7B8_TANCI|nr:NADH dehydrogenase subunit 2, mitochondrial [Tanacetum cinerariifolium]
MVVPMWDKLSKLSYQIMFKFINSMREGTEGDDIRSRIVERSSGSVALDLGRWDSETRTLFHNFYEGSPTPVTALLSIAPIIYISANISRLSIYGSYGATLQQIFFLCSIASMILGGWPP